MCCRYQSKFLVIFLCALLLLHESNEEGFTIKNPIRFPYGGPFMGLFLAVAVPLDLPESNAFVSYNFEANYNLPQNETTYDYPPIWGDRSLTIDRKYVYTALETKINSHGYPGKPCLLRAICEASEYSVNHDGILGEIVHIILTPSTSKNEGLDDYENAEVYGRTKKHCQKYMKKCTISFLGLISWVSSMF